MIFRVSILLCLVLPVSGELKPADISGAWSMETNPRKFAASAVLRRPGNPWPSFWVGHNAVGMFSLNAKRDLLGEGLEIQSNGSFAALMKGGALKLGMEDKVPAGHWMNDTTNHAFQISFMEFKDWKVVEGEGKKSKKGFELHAKVDGAIASSRGRTALMKGQAVFRFPGTLKKFSLSADFRFTGADLGLTGLDAGPLELSFKTESDLPLNPKTLPDPDFKPDF